MRTSIAAWVVMASLTACEAPAPTRSEFYRIPDQRIVEDSVTGSEYALMRFDEFAQMNPYMERHNYDGIGSVGYSTNRFGILFEYLSCEAFRSSIERFTEESNGKKTFALINVYKNNSTNLYYATFAEKIDQSASYLNAYPAEGFDFNHLAEQYLICKADSGLAFRNRPQAIAIIQIRPSTGEKYINEVYIERIEYVGRNTHSYSDMLGEAGGAFLREYLNPLS